MSHISTVSDTAYAYLATLSRLDTNSDGVLSRSERAADEKPGIIKQFSEDERQVDARSTVTSSVMALMMGMRPNNAVSSMPAASTDLGVADLYRNTYGQYDLDIAS